MKISGRKRRHKRITATLKGDKERPRLVVFRSKKHIYAQLVDDQAQATLTSSSTLSKEFPSREKKSLPPSASSANKEAAKELGRLIAKKGLGLGIKKVSFDRSGYKYHGRVKAVAEGAREGGLKF